MSIFIPYPSPQYTQKQVFQRSLVLLLSGGLSNPHSSCTIIAAHSSLLTIKMQKLALSYNEKQKSVWIASSISAESQICSLTRKQGVRKHPNELKYHILERKYYGPIFL